MAILISDQAKNGEGACLPDLIFKPRAASFRVEMPIRSQHWLGVNPVDSELDTRAAMFSATEREHVRQFLARAHLFAEFATLYATLCRIGTMLAIRQAAWLRCVPVQIAPRSRT